MFTKLSQINHRPKPFKCYTTPLLWNDPYISKQMLMFHLDGTNNLASRNTQFLQKSLRWIIKRFNVSSSSKICDFGCGPGLYTLALAERGASVTGIDLSRSSIRYARKEAKKRGLNINYFLKNYLEYTPEGPFDLITMIFCDFCVLSPTQRKLLLQSWHDCLQDDGRVLFDLPSLSYFAKAKEKRAYEYIEHNGFWSKSPHFLFSNTFTYEKEKLILEKYTIIEQNRTREIFNWLQCFTIEAIEKELHAAGFRIDEMYSDVAGLPYRSSSSELALIVKKTVNEKHKEVIPLA